MTILALDIETIATPVQDWFVEAERARLAEEYKKEETIQKHLEESAKGWWKQWGGSKPICICMENITTGDAWGVASENTDELVSEWILKVSQWTFPGQALHFVGFNVVGFDLLNLHLQVAKRKDQASLFKLGRFHVIDLADQPYGWKTDRKGKTLDYYLRAFGLEGKSTTGADVAKLWEEDLADGGTRVLDYCKADCFKTKELYKKLKLFWDI